MALLSGSPLKAWPAAHASVITVGALDCDGRAWFSNYGGWVDACAPGVLVHSTFLLPVGRGNFANTITGSAQWSSTSFAAPKVTAAIADMIAREPTLGPQGAAARLLAAPGLARVPDLASS